MRVLVTGADGFVGIRMVNRLLDAGHQVIAAVRPGVAARVPDARAQTAPLELRDEESVRRMAGLDPEGVIHLAAVASGNDARRDPAGAWDINAVGTARLAEAVAGRRCRFLLASTAEVYGAGPPTPRIESDPLLPCSSYGASKLAGEIAVLEVHRRAGLAAVVARAFPHTGAGQDSRFVIPALAGRIRAARQRSAPAVPVGNLDPVRDLMHVDDVVEAYLRLLEQGQAGETYNVAAGRTWSLREVFDFFCRTAGYHPRPEVDPALMRPVDIPYLVGDAAKLRARTGWKPVRSLEETLVEVMDAQAN